MAYAIARTQPAGTSHTWRDPFIMSSTVAMNLPQMLRKKCRKLVEGDQPYIVVQITSTRN
ncbi:MAG: hypothetical protein JWN70_431 [Planctomycetaceae bacterium]|nr:hypothetical protein [Planctomycetaceae bacterium]